MKHARLGSHGKHVHALERCEHLPRAPYESLNVYYGTSMCGRWAGEARLTDEPVTCPECRRMEMRTNEVAT